MKISTFGLVVGEDVLVLGQVDKLGQVGKLDRCMFFLFLLCFFSLIFRY